MPLADVRVSPLDRGYHFGDGIYEVFRLYNGYLYAEAAHWRRFERSLNEMSLAVPDLDRLKAQCHELVKRHPYANGTLYLQVTRGLAPKREHGFPQLVTPQILAVVNDMPAPMPLIKTEGCKVITHADLRWKRCDIKSLNLLGNVMGAQKAKEAGCYESLFINDAGQCSELSRSNFFAVLRGEIRTMPLTGNILPGITRGLAVAFAREHGMPLREEPISKDELGEISEAFLTNTTADLYPIVEIDGRAIGEGKPGPVATRLMKLFAEHLETELKAAHSTGLAAPAPESEYSSFQPSCG